MAVSVSAGAAFEIGLPQPMCDTRIQQLWEDARNHYDVTGDGKRFLFATPLEDVRTLPFTVVLNWTAGLRRVTRAGEQGPRRELDRVFDLPHHPPPEVTAALSSRGPALRRRLT
jgi:hypothetical protein